MKDMFNLDGRVAVVTGGAGLIGYALAEGLATFGAHIFIADINQEIAGMRAAELTAKGLRCSAVAMDTSDVACIGSRYSSNLVKGRNSRCLG